MHRWLCFWTLFCLWMYLSIFMENQFLNDYRLIIIVEINSVSPPSLFLVFDPVHVMCLSSSGTFSIFLFITDFEWFDYDVSWCSFLYIYCALLSFLDLLVYTSVVLILSRFLVLGYFTCFCLFLRYYTSLKCVLMVFCICCMGSWICKHFLSLKHLLL